MPTPGPDTRLVAEIGLAIYPDCQLSAIYGLADIFRIASDFAAPRAVRVTKWQADADGTVACIDDTHPTAGPPRPGHLILPPSLIMPASMADMRGLAGWLSARHSQGVTLCSVCAGAFVLAETGLLEGRAATTHWVFADEFARRFPGIRVETGRMVIDEGDIITAGGILAWTDLGLTLVERLLGPSVMLETARFLLVDPPGRAQTPYSRFVPRLDHGDAAVLKVQHWLQKTGAKDHAVPALAARAGLEERTFLRRFRKATGLRPTEYAQQVRIAKARAALETTSRPVEQIGFEAGYGDPSAFRKLFHRVTGLSPADYRRRFGLAAA